MYEYWNENYKTYNIKWTKDKARAVLEAWHRKFTEVSYALCTNSFEKYSKLPSRQIIFSFISCLQWDTPSFSLCDE